jgi:hypothetical protein
MPVFVIVRLDRTIQYSEASVMEPKGRGVLDTRRSLSSGAHSRDPVAGMTPVGEDASETGTYARYPRVLSAAPTTGRAEIGGLAVCLASSPISRSASAAILSGAWITSRSSAQR